MLAPYRQKIIKYTEPLTTWQKFYFAAAFLAIFELIFDNESYSYEIIGALALAGLAVEMWPKFVEIWETLLGRVIVVFTYAVVGNFVVAFARHELNQVVGVDPGTLFYATSFVSILFAPVWIITITLIAMLVYMLVKQTWFIITFVPWLLGLYEKSNAQVAVHPKTTRVARIIMLPFMIAFLISVLEFYGEAATGQPTEFAQGVVEGFNAAHEEKVEDQAKQTELTSPTTEGDNVISEPNISAVPSSSDNKDSQPIDTEQESIENLKASIKKSAEEATGSDDLTIHSVIAEFVYYVEGFAHSQCEMAPKERVVSLGEYDILAIKPDDSPNGYSFTVRPCQLKSYEVKSEKVN